MTNGVGGPFVAWSIIIRRHSLKSAQKALHSSWYDRLFTKASVNYLHVHVPSSYLAITRCGSVMSLTGVIDHFA